MKTILLILTLCGVVGGTTILHKGDSISKLGVKDLIGTWLQQNYPNITYLADTTNNGGAATSWSGYYFPWFADYPADILICNAGMHDRDDLDSDFKKGLSVTLKNYKALCPNVKLVWATTTEINADTGHIYNVAIRRHNAMADSILDTIFGAGKWIKVDQHQLQKDSSIAFSDSIHPNLIGYGIYAKNWEKYLGSLLDTFTVKSSIPVKTVAYGVCPNCPADFKNGSPTITISNDTATLSIDQSNALMGVGARIIYNGTDTCFVKPLGKVSNSQWRVSSKTGVNPSSITDATVLSIAHPFASMNAAVTGFNSASYLGTFDLRETGANVDLSLVGYKEQSTYANDNTRIENLTGAIGDVRHRVHMYAPIDTLHECNKIMGVNSAKYDNTKYSLLPAYNTIRKLSPSIAWLDIHNIQIGQTLTSAGTTRVIAYQGVDIDRLDVHNCLIITSTPATGSGAYGAIFIGTTNNPDVYIYNNVIVAQNGAGTQTDAAININCNARSFIYNNIINGDFYSPFKINAASSSTYSKNNVFVNMANASVVTTGILYRDHDAYDVDEVEIKGKLTVQNDSALFKDATNANPIYWDYAPKKGSDLLKAGVSLGSPYNVDITGRLRSGSVWDCGPYTVTVGGARKYTAYRAAFKDAFKRAWR